MSIIPLRKDQSEFFKRLELFKRYQTLPTFLGTLELGIVGGVNLSLIADEISDLLTCDSEQFWVHTGEYNYLRNNWDDLYIDWVNNYQHFFDNNNYNDLLNNLWTVIDLIVIEEIKYENDYLSEPDYNALNKLDKNQKNLTSSLIEDPNEMIGSCDKTSDTLSSTIHDSMQQYVKEELSVESEREGLASDAKNSGFGYFPQAMLIKDHDFFSKYNDDLKNLSSHISQYYFTDQSITPMKMSLSNKCILLDMFSSLLFSQITREFSNKTPKFKNIDEIKEYRLDNFNYSKITPQEKQLYISYVSNVLVLAGFLGTSAIEKEILNKTEANMEFLNHICHPTYQNILKFYYLPQSTARHVFTMVIDESYEEIFDPKTTASLAKGHAGSFDQFLFNEGITEYFIKSPANENQEEVLKIKEFITSNCSSWVIPFNCAHEIHLKTGYSLFNDLTIGNSDESTFNHGLNIADKTDNFTGCQFDIYLVENFYTNLEDYQFHEDSHPALHSLHAVSGKNNLDSLFYLNFAAAFIKNNRPFYAALIIGYFLQFRSFMENISDNELEPIDKFKFFNILKYLSDLPCFYIVEDSIGEYLVRIKKHDQKRGDPIYALLRSFSLRKWIASDNIITFRSNANDGPVKLLKEYAKFSSERTKDYYLEALKLCTDETFRVLAVGEYAFLNTACFLEGEFRSLFKAIDKSAIDDLRRIGIKLKGRNVQVKIEKLTLGTVLIVLDRVDQLTSDTHTKIPKIALIKNNSEYLKFKNACEYVLEFRNDGSHYNEEEKSQYEKQMKLQRILDRLEKILRDGLLYRVLNCT